MWAQHTNTRGEGMHWGTNRQMCYLARFVRQTLIRIVLGDEWDWVRKGASLTETWIFEYGREGVWAAPWLGTDCPTRTAPPSCGLAAPHHLKAIHSKPPPTPSHPKRATQTRVLLPHQRLAVFSLTLGVSLSTHSATHFPTPFTAWRLHSLPSSTPTDTSTISEWRERALPNISHYNSFTRAFDIYLLIVIGNWMRIYRLQHLQQFL
jgi:hypothetical protein